MAQNPPGEGGEQVPAEEPEEFVTPDVSGSGWVIELEGHHFQHNDTPGEGAEYLRNSLLNQLEFGSVELPGPDGEPVTFELKELGILAPVEFDAELGEIRIPDPKAAGSSTTGMTPMANPMESRRRPNARTPNSGTVSSTAYKFTVQFCWKQIPRRDRLENRLAAATADEFGE